MSRTSRLPLIFLVAALAIGGAVWLTATAQRATATARAHRLADAQQLEDTTLYQDLEAGGQAAAARAHEHKTWYRSELEKLALAAGAADPGRLAMRLALIAEGATTLAFLGDRELVIREASATARNLIDLACPC